MEKQKKMGEGCMEMKLLGGQVVSMVLCTWQAVLHYVSCVMCARYSFTKILIKLLPSNLQESCVS